MFCLCSLNLNFANFNADQACTFGLADNTAFVVRLFAAGLNGLRNNFSRRVPTESLSSLVG